MLCQMPGTGSRVSILKLLKNGKSLIADPWLRQGRLSDIAQQNFRKVEDFSG